MYPKGEIVFWKFNMDKQEVTNIQWDAPVNLVSHPATDLARLKGGHIKAANSLTT